MAAVDLLRIIVGIVDHHNVVKPGTKESLIGNHRPIGPAGNVVLLCLVLLGYALSASSRDDSREQRILEIQQLIQQHDLKDARVETTTALRQFKADAGFENLLGVIAAQEGEYAEAERSFQRAVQHDPKFTGAYLNLGRLYQERSMSDPEATAKALDVYRRVLLYDSRNAEATYQSAVLLQRKRDYTASLAHALRLPSESQNSAQVLAVLCGDYAALGDRDNAAKMADQLARSPELSESDMKQLIPSLEIGKRYDLAIALIEALKGRQTLSAEMLHNLGLAYERAEKLPEARAALEQYATGGNLSITTLLELARVAYKQKDYPGALGYLAHAQDLDPNNASLHYYFGFVCLDLNLIAEARNSFEKAVKLEPENPQYNYAMGAASAFRHDPADAIPYFEKYLKLRPEDPRGKLALGAAFFRAKDYQAAEPWLKEVVKVSATATPAHYYLGCIALQERRLDEARAQLSQALAIRPDYADALAELGQYYLLQKDYREAEKQIRKALEIDPDHYTANFYLLNLYTRTEDARRESQARRFEELKKLLDEKTREFLRIVEVRPFEVP